MLLYKVNADAAEMRRRTHDLAGPRRRRLMWEYYVSYFKAVALY
jgi:hypothetical protein